MDKIKLELLQASYLEHFKFAKDLSYILQISDPKRKKIETELNNIQSEIQKYHNEK